VTLCGPIVVDFKTMVIDDFERRCGVGVKQTAGGAHQPRGVQGLSVRAMSRLK
jgi:hypothetical protein